MVPEVKRCLITGVGGFLGSQLAEYRLQQGQRVAGTVHRDTLNSGIEGGLELIACDILERRQVEDAIAKARPQVIYHLAAQSLPLLSWKDPEGTFRANVLGTLNVLEAVREANLNAKVVVASSSAVYGVVAGDTPIREETPLRPVSPYGVSKAAADILAQIYWRTYGVNVIRVRPFLVVGPGKSGDVCSDFARGIVAVEREEQRCLTAGNLEAVRDFLDVRDAVRALSLIAERGEPGSVYNLCSGAGRRVQDVLDALVSLADCHIPVERDPSRLRPADEPVLVGDNSRLRALGWAPGIPLEETLASLLDYWRGTEALGLGSSPLSAPVRGALRRRTA